MGLTKEEQQKEIQEKVDKIAMLLSKGYVTYKDIYAFAQKDNWGVSNRTVDKYIKRAYEQMSKVVFRQFKNTHDYAISNFNTLLQEALKRNELDLAFKIMKEIYKIAGAYKEEEEEEKKADLNNVHAENLSELERRILNEDF